MTGMLLQTKLYWPTPCPDLISRARLCERLYAGRWTGEAFGRKLTLIAAPAGFGKTPYGIRLRGQLGPNTLI